MTSYDQRDPQTDSLITPENSALLIIDYQPTQINSIESMPHAALVQKEVQVAKLAKAYHVPIILSTVNVRTGRNQDTIPQLKAALGDIKSYDRTSINAWEDKDFVAAVEATGRKKLLITALWTEACLTFPTLDALRAGYEVYPIVDSVGGTSTLAHETALRRVEQAGAQLISFPQLACELQRDWNRTDHVKDFTDAMFDAGIFLKLD
ncbi:isochorismatase family protein [Agrilactobacillus fermenti]|uniref:isochorismatase family protein n=1 Tax=Agrilactobacillus fermenti TaxID=2586909 RepID=UPI001E33CD27|nr:isochorismatase family protein [Agrilactobacillus fermenti]MCD2256718.1 isochorismatase family protein [Agrilactobacillus fermenti]